MTTAVSDTFTDTNDTALTSHTMDVGSGWTAIAGTFKISGNNAVSNSVVNEDRTYCDAGQSNYELTCDTVSYYTSSILFRLASIMFRYQDTNNFWLVDPEFHTSTYALYERVGGSFTLRTSVTEALASGAAAAIKIIANGTSLEVFLNGVSKLTYTSSSFQTQTKCGIRYAASSPIPTTPTWDNFLVTYTAAGAGSPWYYYAMQG